MKQLIVEAHRRSLWQVLGIYVVASWIGYQVVLGLADGIGLPDWVPGFAIVLFVIGLPIVLATAFVQEGGPIARSQPAPEPASPSLDPTLFGDVAESTERRATPPATAAAPSRHHFLFTWQRSLLAGIVAFLLLGITAGGYIGMRNAGVGPFGSLVASGVLDAQAPVIVAEFTATNADSVLAMAIGQAFRAGLAQSDAIHVVSPTQVRGTLVRMGRADDRLDVALAREVAERDGVQAVAVGDVAQAGGRYTIAVSLIGPDGSTVMPALQENAADSADVLDAVDRLAKRVRERIGESFRSLRRSAPLSAVTTSSLEALRRYTLGVHAFDVERKYDVAAALLEEAVALDSTFAMAWRKLGALYATMGAGRARIVHAAIKAHENRDRLSEAERYTAIAYYHMRVTEDRARALAAYRALLEISPEDASLNNIGILYNALGDNDAAIDAFRRAMATDSMLSQPYTNILFPLIELGRWDEAASTIEDFARRFGDGADAEILRVMFASARGEYDEAERRAQALTSASGRGNPVQRTFTAETRTELAGVRGRLADAAQRQRQAIAIAQERGLADRVLTQEVLAAMRRLYAAGDVSAAQRELDRIITPERLQQIDPLDRPYDLMVVALADAGRTERATQLIAEYENAVPDELAGDRRARLATMRGAVLLAQNRYDDALRELHAGDELDPCDYCSLEAIARAHYNAGRLDSAAVYYQRYTDTPAGDRIFWDGYYLGPVLERLTDVYMTLNRPQDAAATAARFVALWENADAELQPRVQAKRELLVRLQESRR